MKYYVRLVPEIQFLLFVCSSIFCTNSVMVLVHCGHRSHGIVLG